MALSLSFSISISISISRFYLSFARLIDPVPRLGNLGVARPLVSSALLCPVLGSRQSLSDVGLKTHPPVQPFSRPPGRLSTTGEMVVAVNVWRASVVSTSLVPDHGDCCR
ncbi:unnamed protein product [Protopolystoma xenopodis]|uniref:Uncharacterized protein n=1 Tax=Protopolystoma xenopodis TaxID=117903 RepID=A0A3S5AYC3_9PLAT|nr:unnamed protein product [Protopolystoma xenopodis]